VSPFSHLRTETGTVSETLCSVVFRKPDDGQVQKSNDSELTGFSGYTAQDEVN
jgi:hypothetical protein